MASGEILSCSKFYFELDGLDDLIVKKISGIAITLETAGDKKPIGVGKGGKSQMQATVTGVTNGKITVEFVSTVEDNRLMTWYEESHSEPIKGGGTKSKGARKTGSITLYNQGGDESARWNLKGVMPQTYKSSKLEAGSTNLATETLDFVYENMHRVK
ncbi:MULTISPECIES: phage tail protein [unclassified Anabaena]|jgi:phage tail-like protein|uniref:phage tail protein n=1 Tax=unclassified Anabaena TaxID=2619674 RepID=UPI001445541A|nr:MULTISPECIES: phage tail protein [unclassified Anabaena]MTJ10513.1 phage tail protein [Anabaena sp. UHCC 0204]MTJ56008.1 phage tail protein [Anabaena sp. UHCC 0253]